MKLGLVKLRPETAAFAEVRPNVAADACGPPKPRGRAGARWIGGETMRETAHGMLDGFPVDRWPGGVVYFVRGVRSPLFKVGYSDQVHVVERLAKLVATNADDLVLEAALHGGVEVEQAFHASLVDWRARAEWFRLDAPMNRLLHGLRCRAMADDREIQPSEVRELVEACLRKRRDRWVSRATDFLWGRLVHENAQRRLRAAIRKHGAASYLDLGVDG